MLMVKVNIKGVIIPNDYQDVYDWFGIDATSPNKVHSQLADANGQDLEVEINSGGGSVFDGSEIYTSLKDYQGNVTVKIVGIAASAASVIAMAGDKIMMSPTAQMMIHNASGKNEGDYRDMSHMADVLKNTNQTVANAYRIKTGKSDAELLSMMDDETWLTPQQALENGFIDEIMFDQQPIKVVASVGNNTILPAQVINKIRNTINPMMKQKQSADQSDLLLSQAKFNLLKLRKED
jgi:ATP-dependent protease ClpP protease subunit